VAQGQVVTLDAAKAYTNPNLANLTAYSAKREIDANNVILRKEMYSAAASNATIAGLFQPILLAKKWAFSASAVAGTMLPLRWACKGIRSDHTPALGIGAIFGCHSTPSPITPLSESTSDRTRRLCRQDNEFLQTGLSLSPFQGRPYSGDDALTAGNFLSVRS
jgi:hypothetical protein